VVAFCWPIKHEPDVRAIVPHWAGCGTRAALPVVVQEGAPLAFRHWAPETPLVPDRYGIPTPMAGEWLIPDLILLPSTASTVKAIGWATAAATSTAHWPR
jgi:5-formyltetrahydrofolate cyclo-ligase